MVLGRIVKYTHAYQEDGRAAYCFRDVLHVGSCDHAIHLNPEVDEE